MRAGLVVCVLLLPPWSVAGCACDPVESAPPDAARLARDASLDAVTLEDAGASEDAHGVEDAPVRSVVDAALDRVDGCVSPLPLDGSGMPCLDSSDCAPGLLCHPPGSLGASPVCLVPALEPCTCPPGSSLASHVTASAVYSVCAPELCAPRNTDLAVLGRSCETLRDCAAWMVCEDDGGGRVCALPCSAACACPSGARCESVAVPSGVVQRCSR